MIYVREFANKRLAEWMCYGFDATFVSLENGKVLAMVPENGFGTNYNPTAYNGAGLWQTWEWRLQQRLGSQFRCVLPPMENSVK